MNIVTDQTSSAAPMDRAEALYGSPSPSPALPSAAVPESASPVGTVAEPGEGGDAGAAESPAPLDSEGQPYKLDAPEGLEMTPQILAEVAPVFQAIGLSNHQANKLMPLAGKFAERLFEDSAAEFEVTKADWARQCKADPALGGVNWAQTETLVRTALDAAGATPAFRKLLADSGLGNHPEMMRAMRNIGQRLAAGGAGPRTREQSLYS